MKINNLINFIISGKNEVHLLHLLLSLSEDAAVILIENVTSCDLVNLLSENNNGLFLFSRYYSMLGDKIKTD